MVKTQKCQGNLRITKNRQNSKMCYAVGVAHNKTNKQTNNRQITNKQIQKNCLQLE